MAKEKQYPTWEVLALLVGFVGSTGLVPELVRYPKQIFESCRKWSKSKNENVRWNTAMIFTATAARKYSKDGKLILKPLAEDESSFVSKAALKALKALEKTTHKGK